MTLNFYTLSVIYLVYSFLGWVAETVVATIRGGRFANRGAAAGPFCFIYGTTGVLLAVSFGDLRTEPVYLFFACMMAATVMEWITAKLLERLHRRKWWDYSGKKFNLNGYVCLQYSLLWGALGTASVLWGNNVLLRLCAHIPVWLLRPAVWVSLTVAVLDQIGSAVLVQQYAARHPVLEQLNQRLGERSDTLRRRIALYIEKRIQYAYPAAARQEQTALRKGEKNFLSVSDLLWLFVIGAFLGDMVETVFCRVTAGVWMSRSSLVWGPFSVVWGLALVLATVLLRQEKDRSDRYLFAFGTVMGGVYEYVCSAVTELLFGTVFWDYSKFKFNLGGRINLLYCFFWGIAAVIWMRYGYPLVLRGMEKVRSHVRPWMTVLLAVFMAVNMLTSALARPYDAVFEMDCDFSHNPDDLLRLTAELEAGADVAVGSRYSKGVTVVNWPMSRLLMSYCASRYVRIVTGMPVCDATAGFVGYKREVLAAIDFDRIEMVGYGFQIEMKYTAWKMGFRIGEVPIIFADRTEGTSKMSGGIFGEAFFGVLALPFRTIARKK